MTQKYRTTKTDKIYRKVWIAHNGPIPFDDDGRRCEIHHIDGNSSNNDITNLVCLTINEHYEIHYWQEDWAACLTITKRMKVTPEEKSELASKSMLKRMAAPGFVNPFAKRADGTSVASDRAKNGTLHLYDTSGENNGRYDPTIYEFINNITGEIVETTANKLVKTYNLKRTNVTKVINGSRASTGGWQLYTGDPITLKVIKPKREKTREWKDETIYTFAHTDGTIVKSTRIDMTNRYSLDSGHMYRLVTKERKSHKGWSVVFDAEKQHS
jgi:hypothetical protein